MGNALLKPQNDKLGHKIEEMSVAEKVERLFELVDFDGDGIIDWDEVQRFFKQHGSAKTEQSRVLEVDDFMWNFDRDGNEKVDFNEFKVGLSKIGVAQDTAQLNSLVFTLEKEQMKHSANPVLFQNKAWQVRTTAWRSPQDDASEVVTTSIEVSDVAATARNGLRCSSGVVVKVGPECNSSQLNLTVDNVKSLCHLRGRKILHDKQTMRAINIFNALHHLEPLDCFGNFPVLKDELNRATQKEVGLAIANSLKFDRTTGNIVVGDPVLASLAHRPTNCVSSLESLIKQSVNLRNAFTLYSGEYGPEPKRIGWRVKIWVSATLTKDRTFDFKFIVNAHPIDVPLGEQARLDQKIEVSFDVVKELAMKADVGLWMAINKLSEAEDMEHVHQFSKENITPALEKDLATLMLAHTVIYRDTLTWQQDSSPTRRRTIVHQKSVPANLASFGASITMLKQSRSKRKIKMAKSQTQKGLEALNSLLESTRTLEEDAQGETHD